MIRKIFGTSLLLIALNSAQGHPSPRSTETSLRNINSKIASMKSHISMDQHKLAQIQVKLKHVELASAEVSKNLHHLSHRIGLTEKSLAELKAQEAKIRADLNNQLELLSKQISGNYQLWREPYFKLVLNPDAEKVGRMLVYYRYLNQARSDAIGNIKILQAKIERNVEAQEHQHRNLVSLQVQQKHEQKHLENDGKKRQAIMSQISEGLQSKKTKLAQLIRNKQRLEAMIRSLQQHSTQGNLGFSKKRGDLHLPTDGIIVAQYGTQIEQSELRWTGVLIKARENSPVYAIASGKVVFAKWMEGYGLLMIIDHGGGYMSLYGRNRYLYKKTGDPVHAGEEIATVGNSGGFAQTALYFGLRHNGQPVNPLIWCTSKARRRLK